MNKHLCLLLLFPVLCGSCLAQDNRDTSINIFFQTNHFELHAQQLDSLKKFIRSYPAVTQITGYADTVGTANYNFALSRKRAFVVYTVVKRNIDLVPDNLITYNGESKEFFENWMNRRVQIKSRKPPAPALEQSNAENVGDTVRELNLENIYFVPDKPVLLQESVTYIQELAEQLKAVPEGVFEIVGHVNYQSRLDSTHLADLYELSRLRAKAVYGYLVKLGIPAARMTYRGVGNSQPLFVSPQNEEEKRKNMRVQVIIRRD